LSRRDFGRRLLLITGSVPIALAVMRDLGIAAEAEEIADPPTAATAAKHPSTPEKEFLRCSFCNKNQNEVKKLIAGPTVFICDECIEVCNDIIRDDNRFEARGGRA
jgi:hypothetical protein